jgi:hypothetical protein
MQKEELESPTACSNLAETESARQMCEAASLRWMWGCASERTDKMSCSDWCQWVALEIFSLVHLVLADCWMRWISNFIANNYGIKSSVCLLLTWGITVSRQSSKLFSGFLFAPWVTEENVPCKDPINSKVKDKSHGMINAFLYLIIPRSPIRISTVWQAMECDYGIAVDSSVTWL